MGITLHNEELQRFHTQPKILNALTTRLDAHYNSYTLT